jgi:hypothetical protein
METDDKQKIELSQKDKVLETLAVSMCFFLLLACFLKVMFF